MLRRNRKELILGTTDAMEVVYVYDEYEEKENVKQKIMGDMRFLIAADLITKWGMVAAVEDGEDSSGRSKLRLATEIEVVERAVKCTNLLLRAADEAGWLLNIDRTSLDNIEENEEE